MPQAESPRPHPAEEEKKLPPLCPSNPECAPLGPVEAALDRGDIEAAKNLMETLPSFESRDAKGASLVLEGRSKLETDTLAYGAGGEGSTQALADFRQAIELVAHPDVARLHLARALLSLGRGSEALSELVPLGERYTGDAEVQAALGIAYLSTGRSSRALGPLKKAVQLDPNEPERLIVLGTVHMLLGDLVQAEQRFRGAIGLDGNSPRAHGDLGAVLLLQGKLGEGKAHLERAARMSPKSATYAANLAYAEILADRPKEGAAWAERALELDPNLASAWLNLGLAQVKLGNNEQARGSFEKARALDPSDPRPKNNLSDLDEIEGAPRAAD